MTELTSSPTGSPASKIMELVGAKIRTYVLGTFAELRLADLLATGPKSAEQLSASIGAHVPTVKRLLRTLAGLDIVFEVEPGVYGLTSAGSLLRSDVAGSLRGIAAMFGSAFHAQAWGHLTHSVRTGEPAFDHVFGKPLFEYLEANPELAAIFDQAMTSGSAGQSQAVVDAYDFSDVGTVVDVGGGHGTLLATILKNNPSARGVLYDLPHVTAGAGELFDSAGVRKRVDVTSGSFLEEVPGGGNAYIMKRIIHDWDDRRAAKILTNCRAAIAPGGRVLVVDCVIDDSPASLYGKLLDMEMLVMTPNGKERTREEFRQLFQDAGLQLERIVETASPLKIVVSQPQ